MNDKITVNKVDTSEHIVNGATFQLYSDETFETSIGVYTGGSFEISTGNTAIDELLEPLETGGTLTLYLKETSAPEGYIISNDKYQIVITKTVIEAVDSNQDKFVTTTTYAMTIAKWNDETHEYVEEMTEDNGTVVPAEAVNVVNTPIEITVAKVIANTSTPLTGAEFTLVKVEDDGTPCDDGHGNNIYDQTEPVDESGRVTFSALAVGRYKLEETKMPAGYVRTEGPYYIEVSADGTTTLDSEITYSMIDENGHVYTVQNEPGVSLPATGGGGTTAYTAVGSALVLLAIALLLRKRRAEQEQ